MHALLDKPGNDCGASKPKKDHTGDGMDPCIHVSQRTHAPLSFPVGVLFVGKYSLIVDQNPSFPSPLMEPMEPVDISCRLQPTFPESNHGTATDFSVHATRKASSGGGRSVGTGRDRLEGLTNGRGNILGSYW